MKRGGEQKHHVARFRRQAGDAGDVYVRAFRAEQVAGVEEARSFRAVAHFDQAGGDFVLVLDLVRAERLQDSGGIGEADACLAGH